MNETDCEVLGKAAATTSSPLANGISNHEPITCDDNIESQGRSPAEVSAASAIPAFAHPASQVPMPARGDMESTLDTQSPPRPTTIEVVRSDNDPNELCLLHWEEGSATIVPELRIAGVRHRPPSSFFWYRRALVLPTGAAPYGTTRELFKNIVRTLSGVGRVSVTNARLPGFWALSTWFTDKASLAPVLLITGSRSHAA